MIFLYINIKIKKKSYKKSQSFNSSIQPAAPTFTGNKNGDEEENEAKSS